MACVETSCPKSLVRKSQTELKKIYTTGKYHCDECYEPQRRVDSYHCDNKKQHIDNVNVDICPKCYPKLVKRQKRQQSQTATQNQQSNSNKPSSTITLDLASIVSQIQSKQVDAELLNQIQLMSQVISLVNPALQNQPQSSEPTKPQTNEQNEPNDDVIPFSFDSPAKEKIQQIKTALLNSPSLSASQMQNPLLSCVISMSNENYGGFLDEVIATKTIQMYHSSFAAIDKELQVSNYHNDAAATFIESIITEFGDENAIKIYTKTNSILQNDYFTAIEAVESSLESLIKV